MAEHPWRWRPSAACLLCLSAGERAAAVLAEGAEGLVVGDGDARGAPRLDLAAGSGNALPEELSFLCVCGVLLIFLEAASRMPALLFNASLFPVLISLWGFCGLC